MCWCENEDGLFEIELNNDLEFYFDLNGNFLSIDYDDLTPHVLPLNEKAPMMTIGAFYLFYEWKTFCKGFYFVSQTR